MNIMIKIILRTEVFEFDMFWKRE